MVVIPSPNSAQAQASVSNSPPPYELTESGRVYGRYYLQGFPQRDAPLETILNTQPAEYIGEKGGIVEKSRMALQRLSGKFTVSEALRHLTKGLKIKFIMVMGITGAGKSSIIKTLTGANIYVGNSIHSATSSFEMYPTTIDGEKYVFIDTPGFNDPAREDIDVFREILRWFELMSPYCDLYGILYVHAMGGSCRWLDSHQLYLDLLQALCGTEFYKRVFIITTMWRTLSDEAVKNAKRDQKEYQEGPWRELISGGARVFQHRNAPIEPRGPPSDDEEIARLEQQREYAKEELSQIINHYEDPPSSDRVVPELQTEVRNNVHILETKAGRVLREKYSIPLGGGNFLRQADPTERRWWETYRAALMSVAVGVGVVTSGGAAFWALMGPSAEAFALMDLSVEALALLALLIGKAACLRIPTDLSVRAEGNFLEKLTRSFSMFRGGTNTYAV